MNIVSIKHLSCLDILTNKCVVGHCKLRGVIVDVQHLDEHRHPSCLTWIV